MNDKDMLIAWLNDAHAMEKSLAKVLEHRISDARDYPELRAADEQHLNETKRHAELVEGCIKQLGGNVSTVKSMAGTLMGVLEAPMTALAKDEIVKNCLMDYAAEQFEVASYHALIAAATELGEQHIVGVCTQILQEDEAMASRIPQGLPKVISQHLAQSAKAAVAT